LKLIYSSGDRTSRKFKSTAEAPGVGRTFTSTTRTPARDAWKANLSAFASASRMNSKPRLVSIRMSQGRCLNRKVVKLNLSPRPRRDRPSEAPRREGPRRWVKRDPFGTARVGASTPPDARRAPSPQHRRFSQNGAAAMPA